MKKILLVLFLTFSTIAYSRENVTIIYAFGQADSVANYHRALVNEANQIQNKYTFIFDTKPGAGNAIAANYVKNTPNTILATSPAFFIRPVFYPNESYDISDFRELMPQCNAPLAVSSVKYKTWQEVPKNATLTIASSGFGSSTHLIASQITKQYPNMIIVPFKSPSESMLAVARGDVDFQVGFISEAEAWAGPNSKTEFHILGITGSQSVKNYPLLGNNGFPKVLLQLSAPQHLVVPANISEEKFKEWRAILVKANQSTDVKKTYIPDQCQSISNLDSVDSWFNAQVYRWKKIANDSK